MITQNELKEFLSYDTLTGLFTRNLATKKQKIGQVAGTINSSGYVVIKLKNKLYYAHRLAFLYVTGEMPKKHIDHKNGNRSDNRFINLREATVSENLRNVGVRKNNKTGYTGVFYKPLLKKFIANVTVNRKTLHLGYFKNIEDAVAAYESFTNKHFGEFKHEKTQTNNV